MRSVTLGIYFYCILFQSIFTLLEFLNNYKLTYLPVFGGKQFYEVTDSTTFLNCYSYFSLITPIKMTKSTVKKNNDASVRKMVVHI